MKRTCVLLWGVLCLTAAFVAARGVLAADEPGDGLIKMIINLVSDKDREMRNVGLQQVREQAKGEAATKQFAALLPKLAPDAQVGLLDALGGRGDAAARPAVLDMLNSGDESVRAAALKALGALGQAADVPVMANSLVASGAAEKAAARASFTKLKGETVNAAILAELKQAKPEVRVELLGVLAARGVAESVAVVLEAAKDADASVRLAALKALRTLADPIQTATLVALLKAAKDATEQAAAEQALVAVASKGKEACAAPILAGLPVADPAVTTALLRAAAKAGGKQVLEALVAASKDGRAPVQAEAVRLLANWPDAAAAPYLLVIAKQSEPAAQQAVAVQGLIRQASPRADHPADLSLLGECMKLARRPEEKRMVLGVLGGVPTPQSLNLVISAMDDPALTDEACLAAILIAEDPKALDATQRQTTLQVVISKTKDADLRKRAEQDLDGPPAPQK